MRMMSVLMLFSLKIAAVLLFTVVNCEDEEKFQVVREISPEYTFFLKSRPHNDFMKLYKRDTPLTQQPISEGQKELPSSHPDNNDVSIPKFHKPIKNNDPKVTGNRTDTKETTTVLPVQPGNSSSTNITSTEKAHSSQMDLSNPGVVKRGVIVFSGFALLALAYFIFYRRKMRKNENNNAHNTSDNLQFRYGVLQSNERENMELSHVPLTMDSDEEDDDDLEIFDLGEKRKSMSYVNLRSQTDDVESFSIVNDSTKDDSKKHNLLLDIDDKNTEETLINLTESNKKL